MKILRNLEEIAGANTKKKIQKNIKQKLHWFKNTDFIFISMSASILENDRKLKALLHKASKDYLTTKGSSRFLKIKNQDCKSLLEQLERLGYIEEAYLSGYWQIALRGRLLISQPLKRVFTATSMRKQMSQLIERVHELNNSNKYPHYITHLKVTSEFPIAKPNRGIHIIYATQRRDISEEEYQNRAYLLRVQSKIPTYNYVEVLTHPEKEMLRFLKSGSHILKLTEVNKDAAIAMSGTLIFERNIAL